MVQLKPVFIKSAFCDRKASFVLAARTATSWCCIAIAAADGAALVYYAATSEALTSVAHACALAMGALTAHGRQLLPRRAAYDSLLSAPVARAAASADHGSSPDP